MSSNLVYSVRAAAENLEDYFCSNWCNGDLDQCYSYYDCPISRSYVVPMRITMRLGSDAVEFDSKPWQNFCARMAEEHPDPRYWWEQVSGDNMAAMMYYYLDRFANKSDMDKLDELYYDGREYVAQMYNMV